MKKFKKDQLVCIKIQPSENKLCEFIAKINRSPSTGTFDYEVVIQKIISDNFRFLNENVEHRILIKEEEIVIEEPSEILLKIL